jgi:transcriptional regulator with XRE-family HTH domain
MDITERLKEFIVSKGLSTRQFEKTAGLSNGTVSKITDSVRESTLVRISKSFPDLNTDWLMTGEGEMLRSTYTQNVEDSKNFTQTGNVTVNNSDAALLKAIDEISEQRKMVQKAQEQIDRLLTILEKTR